MRHAVMVGGMIGALALGQVAQAHTPYLKPSNFAPQRAFVAVEAALTEVFFVPDVPLRADFWITNVEGVTSRVENVTAFKAAVVFDALLPADGTYRISTGERLGRPTKWVKVDGVWKMVGNASPMGERAGQDRPAAAGPAPQPPAPPAHADHDSQMIDEAAVPAGAEAMTSQAISRSETYVTRGAPTRAALKPTGRGFEVQPLSHPNQIVAGGAFKFSLLNDGKPAPGVGFSVARGGDAYADSRFSYTGVSDAVGTAEVKFAQPGIYILEVDYPPHGEGPPTPAVRSTTYTLTFEVTR